MRIVTLGDSLTVGYRLDRSESWPVKLANRSGYEVINMAICGETSDEGLRRIDDVIAKKPDIVVFNYGVNDAIQSREYHTDAVPESFRRNIISIITKFREQGIGVIMFTPHRIIEGDPLERTYFWSRHTSEHYEHFSPNEWFDLYRELVVQIGRITGIDTIDMNDMYHEIDIYDALLTSKNSPYDDGVHFSKNATEWLAHEVDQRIKNLAR